MMPQKMSKPSQKVSSATRCKRNSTTLKSIRFIDLFSGIGGIREGFEQAASEEGLKAKCVFTSEIKEAALKIHKQNHPEEKIVGDITQVAANEIPDFDFLLAGFPCQAFSRAGSRKGFADPRGTLFFDVERILAEKQPIGFLLENVEGLVNHDMPKEDERPDECDLPESAKNRSQKIGRTLLTILRRLEVAGYHVEWKVLNASDFGVAQNRKRIYIVGTRCTKPNLNDFERKKQKVGDILDHDLPLSDTSFVKRLLQVFSIDQLPGKSIKDKRGGVGNIHSWDIGFKGETTIRQREILNRMLTERRKHEYAKEYGIDWMDGMPLTLKMLKRIFKDKNLKKMLDDLVKKRYLKLEHPKKKLEDGTRVQDDNLPLGYNIVSGKMSFEVNEILDPNGLSPTLVAMDMQHIYVVDGPGIRPLSHREGLRLFGYPDEFKFDIDTESGYDLLGNTVVVPAIKAVAKRLLKAAFKEGKK